VNRWMAMKGQLPTTTLLEFIKTYYHKTTQQ